MAAYRIGTYETRRVWWAHHDLPTYTATELRDADPEEASLMEKVVWNSATEADRVKLRDLIERR